MFLPYFELEYTIIPGTLRYSAQMFADEYTWDLKFMENLPFMEQNCLTIEGLTIDRVTCTGAINDLSVIDKGELFEQNLLIEDHQFRGSDATAIVQKYVPDKSRFKPCSISFFSEGYCIQIELGDSKEPLYRLKLSSPTADHGVWCFRCKDVDDMLISAFDRICQATKYIVKGTLHSYVCKLNMLGLS